MFYCYRQYLILALDANPTYDCTLTQTAKFMWPTWGPSRSCWPQMGPLLAPLTLLSGKFISPRWALWWPHKPCYHGSSCTTRQIKFSGCSTLRYMPLKWVLARPYMRLYYVHSNRTVVWFVLETEWRHRITDGKPSSHFYVKVYHSMRNSVSIRENERQNSHI